jgi:hypothetical protein
MFPAHPSLAAADLAIAHIFNRWKTLGNKCQVYRQFYR